MSVCVCSIPQFAEATGNTDPDISGRWLQGPLSEEWKTRKMLKEQAISFEYDQVNRFYQKKLNKKERRFFNDLCWETYALAYYKKLLGFSHTVEVEHLKAKAEQHVHKMKKSGMYSRILNKADGTDKHHLLQYIARRTESGERDATLANARNTAGRQELDPEDLFYHTEGKSNSVASFRLFDNLSGNVLLSVLFFVAAAIFIIGFVGAYACPQLPLFGDIRVLLDDMA